MFTTGSFFTQSDASSTEIQSIYGVFDNLSGDEVDASTLIEQTLSNQVVPDTGLEVRIVSDNVVTLGTQESGGEVNGWVIDLDVPGISGGVEFPGERAVLPLTLMNEALFVNTIIPQVQSCEPGPGGFGLVLNPFTGGVGDTVIFDINFDNLFDANDNINVSGELNIVVGTRFESTPTAPAFAGNYRIVQTVDGNIVVDPFNPALLEFNQFVGRRSWREVVF